MIISASLWSYITNTVAQVAQHVSNNQCIRPKPNTIPVKLCVRTAAEGSYCCTRHQDDCPKK